MNLFHLEYWNGSHDAFSCYQLAGVLPPLNIKTHFTSIQVISSTFFRHMPLSDICTAEIWSKPLTFVKHCALDVADQMPNLGEQNYNHCLTDAAGIPHSHCPEGILLAGHLQWGSTLIHSGRKDTYSCYCNSGSSKCCQCESYDLSSESSATMSFQVWGNWRRVMATLLLVPWHGSMRQQSAVPMDVAIQKIAGFACLRWMRIL